MKRNNYDIYDTESFSWLTVLLLVAFGLLLASAVKAGNGPDAKNSGEAPAADTAAANGPKHKIVGVEIITGTARLTCSGEKDGLYCIEATTSLGSLANWVPLCTNKLAASGKFTFVDTCASNYPSRFYRIVPAPDPDLHPKGDKDKDKSKGHANGNDQGNGNDNTLGGK
jgi:hypothetical protein